MLWLAGWARGLRFRCGQQSFDTECLRATRSGVARETGEGVLFDVEKQAGAGGDHTTF